MRTDKWFDNVSVETGEGAGLEVGLTLRLTHDGDLSRPNRVTVRGRTRFYDLSRNGRNIGV